MRLSTGLNGGSHVRGVAVVQLDALNVRTRRSLTSRRAQRAASTTWASKSDASKGKDEDFVWSELAFPSYLQSRDKHTREVCREFDRAVTAAERKQKAKEDASCAPDSYWLDEEAEQSVWMTIRREAERDAATEPLLSSFLYASILAHDSFERALAFVLSNRLANAVMLPTQLFETFYAVLISDPDVREGALADVEACRDRDPACITYSQALLYYKGYHAIQTHRIAHALWCRGQKVMAVALQSRMSEVLAVDIHPAARLGKGILLDHGTGVVIGETAIIGNNVSLLQNVTLGGTGKEHGDRHPKISDNVLIGACATVLGNIRVGEGAQIAAGSLVLKPVEPHTMVAGSPAKPVGVVTGNPAENMQVWVKKMTYDPFKDSIDQPAAPKPSSAGFKSTVAASEAAWDAVAAKTVEEMSDIGFNSSSSSSNGKSTESQKQVSGFHVHVNGKEHVVPATNGHKKAAATDAQEQQQQQQQTWLQSDAQHYMYEQVTGHHLQPQPVLDEQQQDAAVAPPQQQQQTQQMQAAELLQQPEEQQQEETEASAAAGKKSGVAILGIHGGEVDATIDEAVAAVKWSGRKEDPEYVI